MYSKYGGLSLDFLPAELLLKNNTFHRTDSRVKLYARDEMCIYQISLYISMMESWISAEIPKSYLSPTNVTRYP